MDNYHSRRNCEWTLYDLVQKDRRLYLEVLGSRDLKSAQISEIEHRLAELPKDGISCRVNGNRYKYYRIPVSGDSKTANPNGNDTANPSQKRKTRHTFEYLPKSETPLIRQLALHKLLQLRLADLNQEVQAMDAYISRYQRECCQSEHFRTSPGISELLDPLIEESHEQIIEWQNAPFDQSSYRIEDRNVPTLCGINVRSKSEALIANILYERDIPFRYECMQTIGQRTYAPDFTILSPRTGREVIWEHFGMMDSADYLSEYGAKISRYLNSGYLPYRNLITTYETREHPFDVHEANRIVKMMFDR